MPASGPQGDAGPVGSQGELVRKVSKVLLVKRVLQVLKVRQADWTTGPFGPKGEVGPIGPREIRASRRAWDPGSQGDVGPAGEPGVVGLPGEAGPAGPRGEQGLPGDAGVDFSDLFIDDEKNTKDHVVFINAGSSTGSGVLISSDEILTAEHVIRGQSQVLVTIPGRGLVNATVIGWDVSRDLLCLIFLGWIREHSHYVYRTRVDRGKVDDKWRDW
ncbi:MAG: hypothetical protein Ct9H300mP19_15140 [Dehalococcoidia bacterium]|nr:MAG: hypothetical protein Ct9H300mP19_15140 [Dehalococcoidia bacterium]